MMVYETRRGKANGSHYLTADAAHVRGDIYVSMAVLADVLVVKYFGNVQIDAFTGILVAVLIGFSAFQIIRDTVPILVDAAALPQSEVAAIVRGVAGIVDVGTIRTRGWEGNYFIEITATSDIADSRQAHAITEIIETDLRRQYGASTITIHLEPVHHTA